MSGGAGGMAISFPSMLAKKQKKPMSTCPLQWWNTQANHCESAMSQTHFILKFINMHFNIP